MNHLRHVTKRFSIFFAIFFIFSMSGTNLFAMRSHSARWKAILIDEINKYAKRDSKEADCLSSSGKVESRDFYLRVLSDLAIAYTSWHHLLYNPIEGYTPLIDIQVKNLEDEKSYYWLVYRKVRKIMAKQMLMKESDFHTKFNATAGNYRDPNDMRLLKIGFITEYQKYLQEKEKLETFLARYLIDDYALVAERVLRTDEFGTKGVKILPSSDRDKYRVVKNQLRTGLKICKTAKGCSFHEMLSKNPIAFLDDEHMTKAFKSLSHEDLLSATKTILRKFTLLRTMNDASLALLKSKKKLSSNVLDLMIVNRPAIVDDEKLLEQKREVRANDFSEKFLVELGKEKDKGKAKKKPKRSTKKKYKSEVKAAITSSEATGVTLETKAIPTVETPTDAAPVKALQAKAKATRKEKQRKAKVARREKAKTAKAALASIAGDEIEKEATNEAFAGVIAEETKEQAPKEAFVSVVAKEAVEQTPTKGIFRIAADVFAQAIQGSQAMKKLIVGGAEDKVEPEVHNRELVIQKPRIWRPITDFKYQHGVEFMTHLGLPTKIIHARHPDYEEIGAVINQKWRELQSLGDYLRRTYKYVHHVDPELFTVTHQVYSAQLKHIIRHHGGPLAHKEKALLEQELKQMQEIARMYEAQKDSDHQEDFAVSSENIIDDNGEDKNKDEFSDLVPEQTDEARMPLLTLLNYFVEQGEPEAKDNISIAEILGKKGHLARRRLKEDFLKTHLPSANKNIVIDVNDDGELSVFEEIVQQDIKRVTAINQEWEGRLREKDPGCIIASKSIDLNSLKMAIKNTEIIAGHVEYFSKRKNALIYLNTCLWVYIEKDGGRMLLAQDPDDNDSFYVVRYFGGDFAKNETKLMNDFLNKWETYAVSHKADLRKLYDSNKEEQ